MANAKKMRPQNFQQHQCETENQIGRSIPSFVGKNERSEEAGE